MNSTTNCHIIKPLINHTLCPTLLVILRPTNTKKKHTYPQPHICGPTEFHKFKIFFPSRRTKHPWWGHIQPVVRAIEASHAAWNDEFRRNHLSHIWRSSILSHREDLFNINTPVINIRIVVNCKQVQKIIKIITKYMQNFSKVRHTYVTKGTWAFIYEYVFYRWSSGTRIYFIFSYQYSLCSGIWCVGPSCTSLSFQFRPEILPCC